MCRPAAGRLFVIETGVSGGSVLATSRWPQGDERFMRMALEEAHLAVAHGDVPIGAVVVKGGKVIASAHNERELRGDPTAHAEILVLQATAAKLKTRRLNGTTVYVTLEPCPMCAGALVAGRVKRVVYAAADERTGGAWSLYNIVQDPRLNHNCELTAGVMADESAQILQEFFRRKRGKVQPF